MLSEASDRIFLTAGSSMPNLEEEGEEEEEEVEAADAQHTVAAAQQLGRSKPCPAVALHQGYYFIWEPHEGASALGNHL